MRDWGAAAGSARPPACPPRPAWEVGCSGDVLGSLLEARERERRCGRASPGPRGRLGRGEPGVGGLRCARYPGASVHGADALRWGARRRGPELGARSGEEGRRRSPEDNGEARGAFAPTVPGAAMPLLHLPPWPLGSASGSAAPLCRGL